MQEVRIPSEIVNKYKQAKDAYVRLEDDTQEWMREVLEDFKNALHNIVRAEQAEQPNLKSARLTDAYTSFCKIQEKCTNHQVLYGTIISGEVILPSSIVSLYDEAHKKYLYYADTVEKPLSGLISKFRDALDHLIDASDPEVPDSETPLLIAQATEHLLEVAGESLQLATFDLTKQITKWQWLRRLAQSNLPPRGSVNTNLQDIRRYLADARLLKGKVRNWEACLTAFREAFNRAYLLNQAMHSGKYKLWVRVSGWIIPFTIGVISLGVGLWVVLLQSGSGP